MSGPGSVRIRMYNVGFGDCFLLGFPGEDREHFVLLDCGVHSASQGGHKLGEVIADVKKVATDERGKVRLDVVAISHRHRDHVHGFRKEADWSDVTVGEVWMPWTEHPDDPAARRIKDRQSRRTGQLKKLHDTALAAKQDAEVLAPLNAIIENNYKNAEAMTTLHQGFAGRPDRFFLPEPADGPFAGHRVTSFSTPALPGVRVHVLGPSRDEETIRDMDPPGDESYLRLGDRLALAPEGDPLPFERWTMDKKKFRDMYKHFDVTDTDFGTIVRSGRTGVLSLAVGLEQAVNGTSLVLLFECGDATVLMSGDAQWGTWRRLLADHATRDLATKSRVLKVGHHGSHNATPRRFVKGVVEMGGKPEVAFVSVAPTAIESWSDIPREPLLKELRKHWRRVLRSDRPGELDEAGTEGAASAAGNGRPQAAAVPIEVGPDGLWMELRLPTRRDGEDGEDDEKEDG